MTIRRGPQILLTFLVAMALLLTSCGSDAGEQAATDDDPAAPTTTGAPLVTSRTGVGEPAEVPDVDDYIGLDIDEAQAKADEAGIPFRMARIDDEEFGVTMDYVSNRITVEVDDGVVTVARLG